MRYLLQTIARIVFLGLVTLPGSGQAALLLVSDSNAVEPGAAFAVDLTLTAPNDQPFDWLRMLMEYDSGQLTVASVERRLLLSSASSFDASPDGTRAEALFVVPPDPFGPGVIARWHFMASANAAPGHTLLQATLTGLDLDDQPTFSLPAAPLLITVVPEPDRQTLLLAGLAALLVAARSRLGKRVRGRD